MGKSDNHEYNVPAAGTEDWHVPLNENFQQFDVDIEIRHTDDQKSNYTPAAGAKFLAIDTGIVYRGNGADWVPALVLGRIDGQPLNDDHSASLVFGHPSNSAASAVGAVVSGGGFDDGGTGQSNVVYDDYGVIGGGRGNVVGDDAQELPESTNATVAGGENNEARGKYSSIGGGYDNEITAGNSTIAGGQSNTINEGSSAVVGGYLNIINGKNATIGGGSENYIWNDWAVIGGGTRNLVRGNYATIGGGGPSDPNDNNTNNVVWDDYGTIGGGGGNQAGSDDSDDTTAPFATVAGGKDNAAEGESATVGGGDGNIAGGKVTTIAGGQNNSINGTAGAILGGEHNEIDGYGGAILGGLECKSTANCGFAAGYGARARDPGAFVWADYSSDSDGNVIPFRSDVATGPTGTNTFQVRATGGFRFVTGIDTAGTPTAGVTVPSGSGSWSSLSDAAAKTDVTSIDPQRILDGVASLDVCEWSYDSEDGVRHLGPMAQDFYDAFELGDSERHIANVDADGVALAAIQGLSEKLDERDERIDELATTLEEKTETIDDLVLHVESLRSELADLRSEVA